MIGVDSECLGPHNEEDFLALCQLLFLASLQASKLASAHLVFLLVFAGVIPFESIASSSLFTNLEKRLFLLELLSGGRSSLLWLVRVLVPFEVEGGRSCTEVEVVSSGRDLESASPGQPVHEHCPRQKRSTGQAWLSLESLIV